MNFIRLMVAAIILFAPLLCHPQEVQKRWAEYYPLAKGNSWTYSVTGKSKAQTVVWKVVNVQADALGPIFVEWPSPSPSDDSGMNLQYSQEGLRELVDDFFVLKFPLNKGNSWKVDRDGQDRQFVVASEGEQCEVGKLKFTSCAVVRDDDRKAKLRIVTTYAYSVGPVRYEYYKAVGSGFANEAMQEVQSVSYSVAPPATDAQRPRVIVYTNQQYRFRLYLPQTWKGYSIALREWEGGDGKTYQPGETMPPPKKGPLITIRHPLSTIENPRQDFEIMAFTRAQWRLVEEDKVILSASPAGPYELGRNAKYVFALPPRFNGAGIDGWQEVNEIIRSHPLHTF